MAQSFALIQIRICTISSWQVAYFQGALSARSQKRLSDIKSRVDEQIRKAAVILTQTEQSKAVCQAILLNKAACNDVQVGSFDEQPLPFYISFGETVKLVLVEANTGVTLQYITLAKRTRMSCKSSLVMGIGHFFISKKRVCCWTCWCVADFYCFG